MAQQSEKRVAIIGAGVSGLRCAAMLLQDGFDVTIFEARDRVGGRITQSSEIGRLLDVGANWVHSTSSNPIMSLARETGTPLHTWKPKTIIIGDDGTLVSSEAAQKTLDRTWRILEDGIEHSTDNSDSINSNTSLYDHFLTSLKDDCDDEQQLVLGMAHMWGAYVGDRVEKQSLKFFYLEDCINEDDSFVATTYAEIIDRVARPVLKGADVRFKAEVSAIKPSLTSEDSVTITTSTGISHTFHDVVVTVPLGYLHHHPSFISTSPPRLIKAINNISYGRLEKVFITFPTAFWDTGCPDGDRISFMHWLTPSYAPTTNPSHWRLECVSFAALPKPHAHPTLLFYTFGDCSTHLTSRLATLTTKAEKDDFSRHFFEPYYSRLPYFDADTCQPSTMLATSWSTDRFAGYGSYCNFQVGMTDAAEDVKTIRHGMPEKHVWFAGEHTAPFDGLGTVAGAYESGEAVARRIIASYEDSE